MSTYVTRFVEIKNQEGKWELVKWLTKKSQSNYYEGRETKTVNGEEMIVNDHFSDNAIGIRDYLRDAWSYMGTHFKDRGIPEDASEELKAAFAEHTKPGSDGVDYTYNHSYYLLSELEELSDKEINLGWESLEREINAVGENDVKKLLRKVIENQGKIFRQVWRFGPDIEKEIVEGAAAPGEEAENEDTSDILKYVRETYYDVVDGITGVQREVNNIYNIVFNGLDNYKIPENIRVTFYFS